MEISGDKHGNIWMCPEVPGNPIALDIEHTEVSRNTYLFVGVYGDIQKLPKHQLTIYTNLT